MESQLWELPETPKPCKVVAVGTFEVCIKLKKTRWTPQQPLGLLLDTCSFLCLLNCFRT